MNEFLEAVENADDNALMLSRKHCHMKNVSSVVVKNENGRLTRAFLAWPGHQLATNQLGKRFACGIHDHRYDLFFRRICGDAVNANYSYVPTKERGFYVWKLTKPAMDVETKIVQMGCRASLMLLSSHVFTDRWTFMDALNFHCISSEDPCVAWWVREGMASRHDTRLFTTRPEVPREGLYESFGSAEEVRAHVRQFDEERLKNGIS